MIATWLFAGVLVILISLLHHLTDYSWEEHLFKYCFPVLNFFFIVIALSSYGFIFYKYKQAQKDPVVNSASRTCKFEHSIKKIFVIPLGPVPRGSQQRMQRPQKVNVFRLIRTSRFFAIFLLIVTFILFIVVPDLVYLFVRVQNGQESNTLAITCWILYAVGNLADCYIYIFMQPAVRKQFSQKIFPCKMLSF